MFYKINVLIAVFFVSLACAVYTWDTYRRYVHELKAWDHCGQIVATGFPGGIAKTIVDESTAWIAINKCATTGSLD